MSKKYLNQWDVPSMSDPGKTYKVSQNLDGTYVCHCWGFLRNRNRPCHHIQMVMDGFGEKSRNWDIRYANVQFVKAHPNDDHILLFPLLPFGDMHFLATILYDAMKIGVGLIELRERYDVPRTVTKEYVNSYVTERGRKIYGPWKEGVGFEGFQIEKVKEN